MVKQLFWWAVFLSLTIWFVYLLQNPTAWGGWLLFTPEGRRLVSGASVAGFFYSSYRQWRKGEVRIACLGVFTAALIVYNYLH